MKIKKLRIFDLDDTLFETEAKVVVTSSDGTSREITPAEYAVYEPQPGDKFDFSQFQTLINPTLIRSIGKRFYKITQSTGPDRKTVILTARGSEAAPHIRDIIRKYFRVNIEVITLGTGDPMAKANWILNKIQNEGYNDIFFVDDSSKNILATYRTINNLPIKYKLVDITTPRKYEGDNLPKVANSLTEMLKNVVDKERLKKAYKFFVNKLSLPSNKIKLEFGSLEGKVQGKVKVEGDAKPYKVKKYTVIMRTNNPHSSDDQIKTLAHEMWHIKQVEDGKLNTFENSWEGKVYPKYDDEDKERMLPWEIDARINAEDLYKEYNRYARETGAVTKIIKIN